MFFETNHPPLSCTIFLQSIRTPQVSFALAISVLLLFLTLTPHNTTNYLPILGPNTYPHLTTILLMCQGNVISFENVPFERYGRAGIHCCQKEQLRPRQTRCVVIMAIERGNSFKIRSGGSHIAEQQYLSFHTTSIISTAFQ
jgi:hypothetical protein